MHATEEETQSSGKTSQQTFQNPVDPASAPLDCRGFFCALTTPQTGENDKVITGFTEPVQLDPTNANLYSNRGVIWLEKGEPDKAIEGYTQAIALDPNNVLAYRIRSVAWAKDCNKATTDPTNAN